MLDLKRDPWILIRDRNYNSRHVTLAEARNLPVNAIDYLHAEINFATLMLLIALGNHPDGETEYLNTDKAVSDNDRHPIAKIFINSPGHKTIKRNGDFFLKRDRLPAAVCPCCYPAVAWAYTQLVGAGGRGYSPGRASNRNLYIVDAETVGELITRNQLPTTPETLACYFSSPVYLKPVHSGKSCQCQICGKTDNCYSEIHVRPVKQDYMNNPHASTERSGNQASFPGWKTEFYAIANIADAEYSTPPQVIARNAVEGDRVRFLGLDNPQGKLFNLSLFSFHIPPRWQWTGNVRVFHDVVQKLYAAIHGGRSFNGGDYEKAANEIGTLSSSILERGMSPGEAGTEALDNVLAMPSVFGDAPIKTQRNYALTRKYFGNLHNAGIRWREIYRELTGTPPTGLDEATTQFYRDVCKETYKKAIPEKKAKKRGSPKKTATQK
ncbi:hypothetical protein PT300_13370 [Enterobacteriaceae bacterium ESL0689]|nr:hypothetical protein [Enterobacteriaceae bacterium ESL0689]